MPSAARSPGAGWGGSWPPAIVASGGPVAIKELLLESRDLRARLEREARITAKLQHPAIVNVLEAGAWPGISATSRGPPARRW